MTDNNTINALDELRAFDPINAGAIANLCRCHYLAASTIAACEAWPGEVIKAASRAGAERVGYLELVRRAREIVLRGELYAVRRNGRIVTFGANLNSDAGGFVPLCHRQDDHSNAAEAA